jgi:DNA replicative helicase MCM subunit Mcm2 (Cdc46/Mcm family)
MGEMPRSLSVSAERYLVNMCKPGQRVTMVGVFTTFQAKGNGAASDRGKAANAAASTARDVGIRYVKETFCSSQSLLWWFV